MAIAVRNNESLGITIDESYGNRTILIPQEARARANILFPVSSIAQENPIWRPSVQQVYLDPDLHTYPEKGERAITKNGLLLLAAAAGIDVLELGRMKRDVLDDGEIGYEAKIQWRRADGTLARMVGSCTAMRNAGDPKLPEKCETKSLLRAIRAALQIPSKMSAQRLALPFVVVVYTFSPDTSNPETLRTLIAAGTTGAEKMYGGGAMPALGSADGEIPMSAPPAREIAAAPAPVPAPAAASEKAPEAPATQAPQGGPVTGANTTPPASEAAAPTSGLGDIELDFGKHRGKTLSQICADGDQSYIEWLSDNARDPKMKQQCADFLAEMGGAS